MSGSLFPWLRHRACVIERMDDPGSDLRMLENTLRQFALINLLFTRIRTLLRHHVLNAMRHQPHRPYRVVDLGAGACETAAWLLRQAAYRNLRVTVTAYDHDPRVIAYARRHYGHVTGLRIVEANIMDIDFDPAPDFIFGNHILHHLDDTQCKCLFTRLSSLQTPNILFSDLQRSLASCVVYTLAALPLSHSFALNDGLLSIQRGFRVPELRALVNHATGNAGGWRVTTLFPFRIVVTRKRPIRPPENRGRRS